ncbi:MAG: hypothetical protein LBB38_03890 [Puniceicoccales bacterium]|jgi:hypothetical protein|nr:hypothetical protein [Puniceicoccales bacterium]
MYFLKHNKESTVVDGIPVTFRIARFNPGVLVTIAFFTDISGANVVSCISGRFLTDSNEWMKIVVREFCSRKFPHPFTYVAITALGTSRREIAECIVRYVNTLT